VDAGNYRVGDETQMFTPYALLPVQVVRPPADCWLQRLSLAVFEDALKSLGDNRGYGDPRARARHRHETWQWVLSDADYCFSFSTVCSVLNLNVEAVRERLRHYFAPSGLPQAPLSRSLRQPLLRNVRVGSAISGGARLPALRISRSRSGSCRR
jgi:hypothetical protein